VPLDPYRAERDPERDAGVDHTGDEQDGRGDTFVVQEHHATALHWDVRLERDGVLVSWAVPKGLPLDPATNHLAKQTDDHALAHATAGTDAPEGEYGRGHVHVWDSGTYELEKWRPREVKVVLHGSRVDGRYVFFRTRRDDWMLHRMDGRPDGWLPVPRGLRPVLATLGPLPEGPQWSYELAWQGLRVLVAVVGGRLQVVDETGQDVTAAFPELRPMGLQLGSRQVLLDAELAVLDEAGRPDADRLAGRAATTRPGRPLLRGAPVQLLVHDLLHVEGEPLLDRPHAERRAALEALELGGPSWLVPPSPGSGQAVRAAAQERGLAVLAKRSDSAYRPGTRSPDWVTTV